MRVSKSIRVEASSAYYELNDFSISVYPEDLEMVAAWLRAIVVHCGNNPFKHFHFFVTGHRLMWTDLHSMLPLVQLFADTGLKLNTAPFTPRNWSRWFGRTLPKQNFESSFIMSDNRRRPFQRALEEAVELRLKANEKGWHHDWLDLKFDEWFDKKMEEYLEGSKMQSRGRKGARKSNRLALKQAQQSS